MARRVPRSGGGTGDPDAELARRVALQAFDLPGSGWDRAAADAADDEGAAAGADLDACLVDFPEDAVTASADGDRFTRRDALAYSVVWVLRTPAAAGRAFDALAAAAFADCFAGRLTAAVEPGTGAAELLGHVVAEATTLRAADRATTHRVRLAAATSVGAFAIHLDLVVLQRGRVVTVLFLADSPDPVEAGEAATVAERVAQRIPTA